MPGSPACLLCPWLARQREQWARLSHADSECFIHSGFPECLRSTRHSHLSFAPTLGLLASLQTGEYKVEISRCLFFFSLTNMFSGLMPQEPACVSSGIFCQHGQVLS